MKVGDYVRTKEFGISRIKWFDNEEPILENGFTALQKEYKSSPNIIDLIEVGDYVNGCIVTNRRASVNEHLGGHPKQIFILKQEGNYNDAHFEWLKKEDIKSIVTKEQFESMEYKVKE